MQSEGSSYAYASADTYITCVRMHTTYICTHGSADGPMCVHVTTAARFPSSMDTFRCAAWMCMCCQAAGWMCGMDVHMLSGCRLHCVACNGCTAVRAMAALRCMHACGVCRAIAWNV